MMWLAIASVLGATALFVGVIVLSFGLLHGDSLRDRPATLKPVQLVGSEETVFSWARDRCADEDIPDLPARAFRSRAGRVQLISAHFANRRFVGSALNRLDHPCPIVMRSGNNADPAAFNDREWLASLYTEDGVTVYALVHNEYQGNRHPGRCPSGEYFQCWYNAVTLAVSRDGGASFQDARSPPSHLVATVPYQYVPDSGARGIFSPSNIVKHRDDGYYYVLVRAAEQQQQRAGTCLLRTKRLDDPQSWRAWDGSGFGVSFADPYGPLPGGPSDHICEPVSIGPIDGMHESLTYNTYLDKYLLVGLSRATVPGRGTVFGIFYSVSDDLIDWSQRTLLREAELAWTYKCGDRNPILYPSVLDPKSASRNFETTGRRPYLYFTRFHYTNCTQTQNRDLVRVQLEFSK